MYKSEMKLFPHYHGNSEWEYPREYINLFSYYDLTYKEW